MIAKWHNADWIRKQKENYPFFVTSVLLYFIWLANLVRFFKLTVVQPQFHRQPLLICVRLYVSSLIYYIKQLIVVFVPFYAKKQTNVDIDAYKLAQQVNKAIPAISIIVTTYNLEKYIEECITSILTQTYTNLEVIVIDDCSTDATWEILKHYAKKDERIVLYQHKTNQGHPSLGRNKGITMAKAGYVTFVDGDDYLRRDAIASCMEIMQKYQPNMLYAATWYFDDSTRRKKISKSFTNQKNALDGSYLFDLLSANDGFWKFIALGACPKVYQKVFLQKNNITFPAMCLEDVSFSLLAYMYADSIYCHAEKIYFARRKRNTGTKNRNIQVSIEQSLAVIETIKIVYQHFTKLQKLEPIWEALYFTFYILISRIISRYLSHEEWNIFLKEIKIVCKEIGMQDIAYTYFNDYHKVDLDVMLSHSADDYYNYHSLCSTNLSALSQFLKSL